MMSKNESAAEVMTKPRLNAITGKNGMTLLELMVYIALAALLLAPVIMLMHNSSLSMARDAKSLDLRLSGRDVLDILYSDIRNTGFKIREFTTFNADSMAVYRNEFSTVKYDSSSFRHFRGDGAYDSLEIIKGVLNITGDKWEYAERIQYYVDQTNSTLVREITARDSGIITNSEKIKILSYNVEALKFEFTDNFLTWRNDLINDNDPDIITDKKEIKYIRVILALKDDREISAFVNNTPDVIAGYSLPAAGKTMREIHQIVIPVPNNGLYP